MLSGAEGAGGGPSPSLASRALPQKRKVAVGRGGRKAEVRRGRVPWRRGPPGLPRASCCRPGLLGDGAENGSPRGQLGVGHGGSCCMWIEHPC
ncbi:hypothetical protein Y1Q_0014882 [Alligator mississippiensis]|uniref:Uncharacterized protein n=1 Tax=Alligator mississippiensis TaxID=8496 RepID=A0A151NDU4_ALLMI|nr:hypothetical protein Y1Q_0014882 [Alligator mississippiensis]